MTYGYDRNTDYQKLINQDLVNKDYRSAAIHEAQRNEKILGEGASNYKTTDHYSAWLPQTDVINQGMDQLSSYRYDYNQDPAYQAYRKEYLREADRQTRDAMGAYAGMTGGVPSSYAVSAASEAGNYQRSKLTDKIPELAAQDFNQKYNALQLRQNIEQSRIRNSMDAEQQARSQAMNVWTTLGYADGYVASVLGVPEGTLTSDQAYTQWQQQMTEQQWQYQQDQDKIAQAMKVWSTMGYANDYVASVLGVPEGTLTSDQAYTQWQQQQSEQQWQYQQNQDQISQALQMWSALGYANEFVASVLGVKVGTLTSDQKYQEWYMKTNGGQNGGGSGSSGSGSGGHVAAAAGSEPMEGGGSANAGSSAHPNAVSAGMGGLTEEELAAAAAAAAYGTGNPSATGGGYSGGGSGGSGNGGSGGNTGNTGGYGPGLDERTFSGMKQLIRQYMNAGNFAEAQALLAKFEGTLSEAQYNEIASMFT